MRLVHSGPTGDTDNATQSWFSAGEANTGLPEDYSWHVRRMANDTDDFRYDVSMRGAAAATGLTTTPYERCFIRFISFPTTEQGFWFNSSDLRPAVAAGLLTCDASGVIRYYYKGNAVFPGTLLGTLVSAVTLGVWYEWGIASFFESRIIAGPLKEYVYNGQVFLDQVPQVSGSASDSIVVVGSSDWHCYRTVIGRNESTGTGFGFDRANLAVDDAAMPASASRVSYLRVAGVGTYQTWAGAGFANYQARNAWPGVSSATNNVAGIRTSTAGQKQTYLLEDFASAGVSGTILSVVARVGLSQAPATALTLIVIRNGVETSYHTWAVSAGSYLIYRLDPTGWSAGDTVELGLQSGVGTTRIAGITLTVEHDTPVPPIVLGDIDAAGGSWAGNASVQSVAAPLSDPDFAFYWPRGGVFVPGGWWINGSNSHHTFSVPSALRPNFVVRGSVFDVIDDGADGPNVSGTTYDALFIRDPKMRMLARGAYAATTNAGDDAYPVAIVDPQGDAFTPDVLWAGRETVNTNEVARYYGPGMAGDAAKPLSAGGVPAANYIEALVGGGFTAGTSLNNVAQQVAYAGFRKGHFSSAILMDADSYVGDGVNPRVIPTLTGQVEHAFCWPQNSSTPIYRNRQLASGQLFTSGAGPQANSITALGVGSFTVNSFLNTLGVVYSWQVFAYGNDPPPVQPGEGCSDPLPAGTDSGGGLGCKGLLPAGSDTGGGVGCSAGLA